MHSIEKTSTKKELSRKSKIILAVLTALAVLFVLAGINQPRLSPFQTKINFNHILAASYSDNGGVVVDSHNQRMLFVNDKNRLTGIVDLSLSGSPADGVTSVTISGNRVYATAYRKYSEGSYYKSESVLAFTLHGKYLNERKVYEYDEDEYVCTRRLMDISSHGKTLFVPSADEKKLNLLKFSGNNKKCECIGKWKLPERVYIASYYPVGKQLTVFGRSQKCYTIDTSSGGIIPASLSKTIGMQSDSLGIDSGFLGEDAAYSLDGNNLHMSYVCDVNKNTITLSTMDKDGKTVSIISISDNKIKNHSCVYYGTVFFIKVWLHFLSVIWIAICLIYCIIRFLRGHFSDKTKLIALMVAGILFTSFFYSYYQADQINEQYKSTISTQAKIVSRTISMMYGDIMAEMGNRDITDIRDDMDTQNSLAELESRLTYLFSSFGTKSSYYCSIFLDSDDGNCYSLIDSGNTMATGIAVTFTKQLQEDISRIDDSIYEMDSSDTTRMYTSEPVFDSEGNIVGHVVVGFIVRNMQSYILEKNISLFISLLAVFIMLYVSFFAFRSLKNDFKRRRTRPKEDKAGKAIDLIGTIKFVSCVVTGMDAVIMVYVAQSLCPPDISEAARSALVAIPPSAFAAGGWLGSLAMNPLSRKIGQKMLSTIFAVIGTASMAIQAVSVMCSSLELFCVGKFFCGFVFIGILKELLDSIPFRAKNDTDRFNAFNSGNLSYVSASILSALLGGYISEMLSFEMIYIVGAVISVAMLLLGLLAYDNTKLPSKKERKNKEKGAKSSWGIFLTTPMLMFILFYLLPKLLIKGYGSFAFPIYASASGISTVLLSNINVFAMTLGLLTDAKIKTLSKKYDRVPVMTASYLIICVSLIMFIVSPNIYWAIAVLMLSTMAYQLSSVPAKLQLASISEDQGVDPKETQPNYSSIESAIGTVQSPIVSGFLAFGTNIGCALLGLVTGIMLIIYRTYDKVTKKRHG